MAKKRVYTSRLVKQHRRALKKHKRVCKTAQKEAALIQAFGNAYTAVQEGSQKANTILYETLSEWLFAGPSEQIS
jgi:DUF438 domain-containing protein